MSRYRPSMPPVVPYSGPLEPNEPDEPMPVKLKVDAFLNSIKQYEDTGNVPFKDTDYRGMMGQPEEPERRPMDFRSVGFKPVVFKNQE